MNEISNTQLITAVNQVLMSANLPTTNEVVQYVIQSIMPFLNQMTVQMNQTQASFQCILQSLVNQNRQQIIEIAKLKQIREEMPRMFCESPVNGFGFCIDHGKEKMIGKLKVRNICHCYIVKNECKEELLYVSYSCKDNDIHHTVVPLNKLSSKNLLPLFESFCYVCRNKSLANDYIAHCINNFSQKSTLYFPEYAGFSFFENDEKGTFVRFDCNRKKIEMELLKHCSPCFIEKVLPSVQNRPLSITEICEKYFDTDKKMLLFVFSLCGLLSSFFLKERYSLDRILTISAPDAASIRFATLLIQIFNRGAKPLTFDSRKSDVTKALFQAKDETIIINDCSLIGDDKRRMDMLQHILTTNDNMTCKPHNLAIFSTHAQYILPPEKKICLTLPENFSPSMTKAEEIEMCDDLNFLINVIISYICKNYEKFQEGFRQSFDLGLKQYQSYFNENSNEIITAGTLLNTVYVCIVIKILGFKNSKQHYMSMLIRSILSDSQTVSGTSADAVSERFIAAFNDAVRSDQLKIIQHSKEMNFEENTNQLIVKDDLLILEESTIEKVILPFMRTADNMCRVLKCLNECEYLHSTKKNRYPLVVYSYHRSFRPALIALKSNQILDADVELMIQESQYSEWYRTTPAPENFIPITENRIGGVSYQVFDEKCKNNMHFFALGSSSSGKTHCLTERMVSLQKLHRPIIVFDTSESFTEEEILEKLSVGCEKSVIEDVKTYISDHITFHHIEEDGIPVDLLKLGDSSNVEDTIRKIESIVESHNTNMGIKQQAVVHAAISDIVQKGNVDMVSLYEALTSEQIPYNLVEQLTDTLSFFVNFKENDRDWGELIEESKDIIVISTEAVRSSGGSGLIDMLLMSLYYYQQAHNEKHLSIFIDEIKTQWNCQEMCSRRIPKILDRQESGGVMSQSS